MTRGRYTVHLERWTRPARGIPPRRWALAIAAGCTAAAASWASLGCWVQATLAGVGAAAATLGVARIGEE